MRDWAALAVSALVYALSVNWAAGQLPAAGVPLRFDAAGEIVRVGSRSDAVTIWIWLGVGMLALGVALVALARLGPLRIMNIPHRSYWMARQRQPAVRRMLSTDVAAIMSVTIVFLALLPLWTVQGSRATGNVVAPSLFWVPTAIYLACLVSWAVWLTLRRYRPASEE
jgi:hypothetical protein